MGFLRSLFKKTPPSLEGEITFVSGATGMVSTTDKQALTFNVDECRGFVPAERQMVRIESVEGMTAKGLTWIAEPEDPKYDPEARYESYQLTVLFDESLPSEASKLESLLRGGLGAVDVSSERAVLDAPVDNLVIRLHGHDLFAQQVHLPFPAAHMDQRKLSEQLDCGHSFVGITGPVIPLARLRPTLGPTLPDPWGIDGVCRSMHQLVLQLIKLGGTAVVLNRGGELVVTADEFTRLSGDLSDQACVPFGAWLDCATTNQHRMFRSWGMLAFGLVDLAVLLDTPVGSPVFDSELNCAANAVLFAAMTSVRRNREFEVGEKLMVPESVDVSAYGASSPSDASVRYRIDDAEDEPFWILRRD
jgi:hypothetical protein